MGHGILNLPVGVDRAPLPQAYEAATQALAECSEIDECKDWADKAQALASYARQSDDDTLRRFADRIRARAVRRSGELLKTFQNERARTDLGEGADTQTQRRAAESAGMSKWQEVTAVRVANVPADQFDAAVESPTPPTLTVLADMGRVREPGSFKKATHLLGAVRRFAAFCDENGPRMVAGGVMGSEVAGLRAMVATIDSWLDLFVVSLGKDDGHADE